MTDRSNDCLVSPDDACPTCGERNIDLLVWIDDDSVQCSICGTVFDPLNGPMGGEPDAAC